jgi:hypothetical protein
MSDTAHPVPPMLVLRARAEARALLYAHGKFGNLDEATNPLRRYAIKSGLLEMLGRERVEAIILDPFERFT